MWITRLTAAFETSFARLSNATVAKPIVPSRETARAPESYGLTTEVTCGTRETRCSRGTTTLRTAGASTRPASARKTIWSVSPAWARKRPFSRELLDHELAARDGVEG